MKNLSDELLVQSYLRAKELNLNSYFLSLLLDEITHRELVLGRDLDPVSHAKL